MDAQPIRPSRWWYGVAAMLFLASAAFAVAWIAHDIFWLNSGLQRVIVPGHGEIALNERGSYQIYYEYRSVVGDRVFMTGEDLPELECHLVAMGSNAKVQLAPVRATTNYDLGSRAGKAIFSFEIERPGIYILSATYPQAHLGPDVVLAVSHGSAGNLLIAFLGSILMAISSFVVSVVICVVTAVKRSKAKKLAISQAGTAKPLG